MPLRKDGNDRPQVPLAQIKILFARSGNRCAFPACTEKLVEPATDVDPAVVSADIAHIVAAGRQGPRAADLTDEQLSSHENLVLLCKHHHGIVDKQKHTYSVHVLQQIKRDHENLIASLTGSASPVVAPLVTETLYSSLLPLSYLPSVVFSAEAIVSEQDYAGAKARVRFPRDRNILTPFLIKGGRLFTFSDIRTKPHPFVKLIRGPVEAIPAEQLWKDA